MTLPRVTVYADDCLRVLANLPDNSIDAVVTDPPYGLSATSPAKVADALTRWGSGDRTYVPDGTGFMGQAWDAFVPPPAVWDECLRVLKPGGHLVAFAGARTHDLMGLSIRLAGFEIRDGLAWLYASGFPKGSNLDEAMADHLAGNTTTPDGLHPRIREVTAYLKAARDAAGWTNPRIDALFGRNGMAGHWTTAGTQPACPSLAEWAKLKEVLAPHLGDDLDELVQEVAATNRPDDWGQRESDHFLETLGNRKGAADERGWSTSLKPAFEPVTLARKPLARVPGRALSVQANVREHGTGALNIGACRVGETGSCAGNGETGGDSVSAFGDGLNTRRASPRVEGLGRWPANVVLDEAQADVLRDQSRFFYCAKAGKAERPAYWTPTCNCESTSAPKAGPSTGGAALAMSRRSSKPRSCAVCGADWKKNVHSTVKPLALMRWLVRLVTPPGGVVLDPFAGSGTTLEAALLEGFAAVGIEANLDFLPLIETRMARALDTS